MNKEKPIVYPYIPNSVPAARKEMLKAVGADSVDEFYRDIPDSLRLKRRMNLPEPFLSEYALRRHVEQILAKNKTCQDHLSFLGASTPLDVVALLGTAVTCLCEEQAADRWPMPCDGLR